MYHYTESGLDNVWLQNGYTIHTTPYGKGVSIVDADSLHRLLALRIADKKGRISGKELRFLRSVLDLSQDALAKMLDVTDQSVSLWERSGRVPKSVDTFVRTMTLGKLDGDTTVAALLDRITTVDRMVHQKIVARETTRKRWTTTVTADDPIAA